MEVIFKEAIPQELYHPGAIFLSIDIFSNSILGFNFSRAQIEGFLASREVLGPLDDISDSLNLIRRTQFMKDEETARIHREVFWSLIRDSLIQEVEEGINLHFSDNFEVTEAWSHIREELASVCNKPEAIKL